MKKRAMFVAVRMPYDECDSLELGHDYFTRPMAWGMWFKAIFPHKNNPWRFARVFGISSIKEFPTAMVEDNEFVLGPDLRFALETPNLLLVIHWATESIYYGSVFRVWEWPVFKAIKEFFTKF